MYYHAAIWFETGKRASPSRTWELDLSREDLVAKIVAPYLRNETFFCGGVPVDPRRVQRVHFNETDQASKELLPFIKAERRHSGVIVISGTPDEFFVTSKGREITRQIIDEVGSLIRAAAPTPRNDTKDALSSDRIFLVHGHDLDALLQTENMLLRWRLTPVILRDQPNEGKTVIEKIEDNSDVQYAIVLMTPDDVCGPDEPPRARQNVVFEWGYLMARLGRNRVACLRKDSTEIPSDLHGIVRIDFSGSAKNAETELRRELLKAGFTIKE